ncbi:hypothetical protein [Fulvivirga sediminis]|uniref:Uncharacterized protein n=1 Tax=Fulvivirga sediminis TaxID=2803949 RepID=A0A937F8U3_9BACT|nr:hypothetical protein [Fulvivirga sediminis]MBL3658446.1 hypothetical protein [Fulvivirga sediminis]
MSQVESNTSSVKNAAKGFFHSFRELTTWKPGDNFLTKTGKVLLHIVGIFLLIALSPVLLFSLIVAFLIAL